MRIMIAIHGLDRSGAEKVASMWGAYLQQCGHEVSVLVRYRVENEYDLHEQIQVLSVTDTVENYLKKGLLDRLSAARRLVKRWHPDVLICFLPKMQIFMMLATIGMRMRRIETIRNNPWLDQDVGRKRILWNYVFHRSDAIILQTEEQGEYFSAKLRKKCVVISNPIASDVPIKRYSEEFQRRFVSVGRLNVQKNYPMMIRAFSKVAHKVPGCTLDIFGEGTEQMQQVLNKLIIAENMMDCITLRGRVNNITERLPEYDAFLMSSDYEGMSNALAEAMAAGLVCVTTNCKTGPRDLIVDGKEGYLTRVGDVEDFAKTVLRVTSMSKTACAQMGQAARKKVLRICSLENTLLRLESLMRKSE